MSSLTICGQHHCPVLCSMLGSPCVRSCALVLLSECFALQESNSSQFVWIIDYTGFGLGTSAPADPRHLQPRSAWCHSHLYFFPLRKSSQLYTCNSLAANEWLWGMRRNTYGLRSGASLPCGCRGISCSAHHDGPAGSCNPMQSSVSIKMLQNHYPERLARAICINAPWGFSGFWGAVSAFMDERTKKKVSWWCGFAGAIRYLHLNL